jgi:hypothetical protein
LGREGVIVIASFKKNSKPGDTGTLHPPPVLKKGSRGWFMKFTGIEIQQR